MLRMRKEIGLQCYTCGLKWKAHSYFLTVQSPNTCTRRCLLAPLCQSKKFHMHSFQTFNHTAEKMVHRCLQNIYSSRPHVRKKVTWLKNGSHLKKILMDVYKIFTFQIFYFISNKKRVNVLENCFFDNFTINREFHSSSYWNHPHLKQNVLSYNVVNRLCININRLLFFLSHMG
jgi:hypothetical protein